MDTAYRPLRRFYLIVLCLPMSVFAVDLDDYTWRNRLLLVVAPEASNTAVKQVRDTLERYSDELVDRDLLIFQLFMRGQSLIGDRPIAASQVQQLRAKLGVDTDERVLLLVGKDGSVKRRAPLLTDLQEIFRQIDAMPMRRNEVWEREQSGGSL